MLLPVLSLRQFHHRCRYLGPELPLHPFDLKAGHPMLLRTALKLFA
jgi:hypothetical protein